MNKRVSLRGRWIRSSLGIVCTLGLACVLALTAVFASYYYSNMESDLRSRARMTANFFADYLIQDEHVFEQTCISYTRSFESKEGVALQFLSVEGTVLAASDPEWESSLIQTPEVREALDTRGARPYTGNDPVMNGRIMAVSVPVIHNTGKVIGLLRYVTSTKPLDMQILLVAMISLGVLLLITTVVLFSSDSYIRSILSLVDEITEKAQRIAGGTYGIRITAKYNDELGELANAINDMSAQINQNEKTQTEFISSLSHELRTPLTAITGWSETLLGSESLDAQTRRGMEIIRREANRLTEMVVDLLDFTRIQGGRMTLNVEQADIRGEFEDTVYMYASRLAQDGIVLNYQDSDEEIPEITCDPKRLRQVFLNILDNAAKHGGEGKTIDASIHADDENVFICIRDYGPGIPEDEISLVKSKFYKGSSKARGSGIGLAVSDEIVQMHGGSLTLENAPGGGTLVTVCIPAVQ